MMLQYVFRVSMQTMEMLHTIWLEIIIYQMKW